MMHSMGGDRQTDHIRNVNRDVVLLELNNER
jgi:hypothetical protein